MASFKFKAQKISTQEVEAELMRVGFSEADVSLMFSIARGDDDGCHASALCMSDADEVRGYIAEAREQVRKRQEDAQFEVYVKRQVKD